MKFALQARTVLTTIVAALLATVSVDAQVAIRGTRIYTMNGPMIENGVVVIRDGKIAAVGPAASTPIPEGFRVLEAAVVTPGLVDAHSVMGLAGQLNDDKADQDQLERSEPMQPELRALDAYNPQERLIEWVRGFGVTTVHTGHAPGEAISGMTMIVKTRGDTVDDALVVEPAMLAGTLDPSATKEDKESPGTRGKLMAILRQQFIDAQDYRAKRGLDDPEMQPARNLRLDAIGRVLKREIPLILTAHRAQDIASALRFAEEFKIRLVLDGAAESYLVAEKIAKAKVPVVLHPTMARAYGETENLSFETAGKLRAAGVTVALQSGYESYVPKTRVILFEAGIAAANGLTFEQALATITRDAAAVLGIGERVGRLAVGMDGDVALYDGDPFEYTTHCIGTVIEGEVVSTAVR
ncbi:MAG: amidohydrolase family protein [Planctomycetota bacterium]